MTSKLLKLDSTKRALGAQSNSFRFAVPHHDFLNEITSISILNFSCINGLYNVNPYNNVMYYTATAVEHKYTMPPGSYTLAETDALLLAEFTSTLGAGTTIVHNQNTGKCTITFPLDVEINTTTDTSPLMSQVYGFWNHNSTNIVHAASSMLELGSLGTVYLNCAAFSKGCIQMDDHELTDTVIALNIGEAKFGEKFFHSVKSSEANTIRFRTPKNIGRIDISIRDADDRVVDLNGCNWQMLLSCAHLQ